MMRDKWAVNLSHPTLLVDSLRPVRRHLSVLHLTSSSLGPLRLPSNHHRPCQRLGIGRLLFTKNWLLSLIVHVNLGMLHHQFCVEDWRRPFFELQHPHRNQVFRARAQAAFGGVRAALCVESSEFHQWNDLRIPGCYQIFWWVCSYQYDLAWL